MYCKHCGKGISAEDKFCKHCGGAVEEHPKKEPAQVQMPATSATKAKAQTVARVIGALLQIFLVGLLMYWIWYTYGCSTGKYPNTGDRACRWFYSFFHPQTININGIKIDGGNTQKCVSTGCGYDWRSSCTNRCYTSLTECRASGEACSGNVQCRQCP